MIRASAKNNAAVTILTSPSQYSKFMTELSDNSGCTTFSFRKNMAAAAYTLTSAYDSAVSGWLSGEVTEPPTKKTITFETGFLETQRVCELWGLAFVFVKLVKLVKLWLKSVQYEEKIVYEVKDKEMTATAAAYVRARNADPMCSFGDFVAISHEVDVATAMILKIEVSDGIIAPSFVPEALEVLKADKGGKFIVLKADPNFQYSDLEYRMVGGVGFMQKRNDALFDASKLAEV
eukprot:g23044.t1